MNAQIVENTGHCESHHAETKLLSFGLGFPLLHPVFHAKPSIFWVEDNAKGSA